MFGELVVNGYGFNIGMGLRMESVTEEQYKEAVQLLLQFAYDVNAIPPRAHPGDSRPDIAKAHQVVKRWGFDSEYKFERGKQVLYVGGVLRN